MSYGNVHIRNDLKKLKESGVKKEKRIEIIAKKISCRYCDISLERAKTIAKKIDSGRETTKEDWAKATPPDRIEIIGDRRDLYSLGDEIAYQTGEKFRVVSNTYDASIDRTIVRLKRVDVRKS